MTTQPPSVVDKQISYPVLIEAVASYFEYTAHLNNIKVLNLHHLRHIATAFLHMIEENNIKPTEFIRVLWQAEHELRSLLNRNRPSHDLRLVYFDALDFELRVQCAAQITRQRQTTYSSPDENDLVNAFASTLNLNEVNLSLERGFQGVDLIADNSLCARQEAAGEPLTSPLYLPISIADIMENPPAAPDLRMYVLPSGEEEEGMARRIMMEMVMVAFERVEVV